ncbi:MAG: hypothetical protein ABJZ55_17270 [Fuerstiella sp.]
MLSPIRALQLLVWAMGTAIGRTTSPSLHGERNRRNSSRTTDAFFGGVDWDTDIDLTAR